MEKADILILGYVINRNIDVKLEFKTCINNTPKKPHTLFFLREDLAGTLGVTPEQFS